MSSYQRKRPSTTLFLALAAGLTAFAGGAPAEEPEERRERELPFKDVRLVIELTDNDIEFQAFVDGTRWSRLQIFDPHERPLFGLGLRGSFGGQGLSELLFASEPDDFPELVPDPSAFETVEAFLRKFPAGPYEFEALTISGEEIEGAVDFSHALPALPEIVAPLPLGEQPPVLDPDGVVIAWYPVSMPFQGDEPIEIVGYQIVVEQVKPFRKLTIDLPAATTSLAVPSEFLDPRQAYDFEVIAFEARGNSSISVGEFETL